MGAEGREPSGEDRSWKLGDRDALTRRGKFYTTAKRLHNKAQGRFSAPWVHVRITHSQPRSGCTTKRHSIVCNGIAPIRCKTSLRFICGHLSRPQGALKRPWALLFIAFGETKPTPSPLRQRGSSFARAGSDLPSPISDLRSSSFQLPAPSFQLCNPRVLALWSTVIHHRFSSAPRSAPTLQGPPRFAPAPFVVPPSGGLSFPAFPAEAGTPTGSSHLEQAPGRPRRSTLRVDSVGRVHDSEVGMHRCGHNPPVSPEGTSLIKPRVEPMRGTSKAQPWVTRTTQNGSPKGWPYLCRSANIEPRTASVALLRLRFRARTLHSYSCSASAVLVLVIEGLAQPKLLPSPPIFVDQRPFVFLAI